MQTYESGKNPRVEKLRDFRKRGKRPCGGKRCGVCGWFYHGWVRSDRRNDRQSLQMSARRIIAGDED